MNLRLLAKSASNPETPYHVSFEVNNGVLRISCSCPAGSHEQLCKHVIGFLGGDKDMLYDVSQRPLLDEIIERFKGSNLSESYSNFILRKKEIEKIQRQLKKELKDVKQDFALKLIKGINILLFQGSGSFSPDNLLIAE